MINIDRQSLLARAGTLAGFDNVAAARRLYAHQRSIASHSVGTALQWPQDQSAALSLSVIISQYFIGGMTPEICFHRFRDLAQGDTGTGDERFEQDVAGTCAKPLTAQGAMNPPRSPDLLSIMHVPSCSRWPELA